MFTLSKYMAHVVRKTMWVVVLCLGIISLPFVGTWAGLVGLIPLMLGIWFVAGKLVK